MKAIVIFYEGTAPAKAVEKDIVGTIANLMQKAIIDLTHLEINVMDETSVARAIIGHSATTKKKQLNCVEEFFKEMEALGLLGKKSKTYNPEVVLWILQRDTQEKFAEAISILSKEHSQETIDLIKEYSAGHIVKIIRNLKHCFINL